MRVTDKSGCRPDEAVSIVTHILESCKHLEFAGLMTIGAFDYEPTTDSEINPDFQVGLSTCSIVSSSCNARNVQDI